MQFVAFWRKLDVQMNWCLSKTNPFSLSIHCGVHHSNERLLKIFLLFPLSSVHFYSISHGFFLILQCWCSVSVLSELTLLTDDNDVLLVFLYYGYTFSNFYWQSVTLVIMKKFGVKIHSRSRNRNHFLSLF